MDKEIEELSELFKKTLDECHQRFLDYLHNGCKKYNIEETIEATEDDIGKLCLFWDYGTDENARADEVHILMAIKTNERGKKEFWCDGCGDCGYYHARRLTPTEVENLTGYKVEVDNG